VVVGAGCRGGIWLVRRYTPDRMGQGDHDDGPFPEGDDDARDDAHPTRGAPPDPLDRVWVHPTELPSLSAGAPPTTSATATRRARWWAGPVAAGAAGALITVVVLSLAGVFDRTTSNGSSGQLATATPNLANVPDAAAHVGLSLVAVTARDGRGLRQASGVCIRHAGEVLTTATLVGDAKTVDIETADGVRRAARVVGRDRSTNLALVAFDDATQVPAAPLADHAPAAGTPVWVIGAADGSSERPWISAGTLSSTDGVLASMDGAMSAGLFETDAATGNVATGGALVDRDGDVVAIVIGAKAAGTTTYAVPIATAVAIGEELHTSGFATHGWAGFTVSDGTDGPMVASVTPESPAAKAGVRTGDVIETMNGRAVDAMSEILAAVRSGAPGEVVTFELRRGSTEMKVQMALAPEKG
jgi:S1-C subfamily serine protease